MWWFFGDIALVVHITLWFLLGAGVVVAATGWMRRRKLAFVFWPTMAVTLVSMAVPGCILTDFERWLRQMEVPGWTRDMSLARTVSGAVTGYHPPDALFTALGVTFLSGGLCLCAVSFEGDYSKAQKKQPLSNDEISKDAICFPAAYLRSYPGITAGGSL